MRRGQRRYRNVVINLPPRHMKSALASVLYPAWRLGCDPAVKFICISYGDDLAHDLSAQTRKIMRSPLYKQFFPSTVLDKSAVDHIRTTMGGYRYATAVGSDITGFGADEIIEAIAGLGTQEKPALIVLDGNGIGRGVLQELGQRQFKHVLPGSDLERGCSDGSKLRRFNDGLFNLYNGLVRFPNGTPGRALETLLAESQPSPMGSTTIRSTP
jgi:hypothetical protein